MKKSRVTLIILFGVLGVLLLAFFMFNDSSEKKYQWHESYKAESDQPYGTSYIKKLLDGYRPNGHLIDNEKKPLTELLDSASVKNPIDYVFIGQSIYMDPLDKEALFNFIYKGNDAFISSLEIPEDFLVRIFTEECDASITYESTESYSATFNFYHDTLRTEKGYSYIYRYGNTNEHYYWNSLNDETICDSTKLLVPLGYILPHQVNFFRIKYGLGNLYLHTNPIAFTNYFIRQPDKAEYAAGVFSHLHGQDILWDERSKVPFINNNNNTHDSPLYYIMAQPSLKYAWWLLLITAGLYLIFGTKRKQRIIPVLDVKSNTSLEFVKLISSLHYQNSNHLDMARKKMKYFQYFIRSKYGIHTQTFSDDQIKKLAEKSKVNLAQVQSIISQYNSIERDAYYNIEAGRLADFYYAIENFYKHCK